MNIVVLIGNLTRDVEIVNTAGGTQVGKFGIAVNRKFTNAAGEKQEEVYFGDCVAFGKTAETCAAYIGKGSKVCVQGRLKREEWEDKTSGEKKNATRIIVDQVQFLDKKGERGEHEAAPAPAASTKFARPKKSTGMEDPSEIPF